MCSLELTLLWSAGSGFRAHTVFFFWIPRVYLVGLALVESVLYFKESKALVFRLLFPLPILQPCSDIREMMMITTTI